MVFRSEIDFEKLDFYSSRNYCMWCKTYDNERVYIRVHKWKYDIFHNSYCEKCLKMLEKEKITETIEVDVFKRKYLLLVFRRSYDVFLIIKKPLVYKKMYVWIKEIKKTMKNTLKDYLKVWNII